MKKALVIAFAIVSSLCTIAQEDSLLSGAPKVYIDCFFCDQEYFRQQTPYLNFVRDRLTADVHILATRQNTGSGGDEIAFQFIGMGQFEGNRDTLTFATDPNQTQDEIRELQLKYVRLGMMRYLVLSDLVDLFEIQFEEIDVAPEDVEDPWNNWVFSTSVNGWFNGQETQNSTSIWANVNIDQVKESHRWAFNAGMNYNEQNFTIGEDKIKSLRRSQWGSLNYVKSLTDHWSVGMFTEVYASIFDNYEIQYNAKPGIEYNIFPYSNSSQQQLRIGYRIGALHNTYNDTTIYNMKEEFLPQHNFEISYQVVQKWGSVSFNVRARQYFTMPEFYNINMRTNLSVRLFKGFNFNIGGNFTIIRDQLNLPKQGASEEEILLQQKQLATGYSYWGNAGISYTFGSIYNNVVNPRFGY